MKRALENLKILDFTTLLPGPFGTMMMSDLGAEVLRIESPTRPDLVREMGPFDEGISAVHGMLNRSKRSLALDLKAEGASGIVHRLITEYDILIEQFRPGVMKRLGLDYESLKEINPKLIYCSITGYGQTGPYKNRAGHDLNFLSLSGMMSYTGRENSGPLPLGTQLADIAGGSYHAVIGILAAVNQRNISGEGQSIDISITDAVISMNVLAGVESLVGNKTPQREEMLLNGGIFYDYYQTKDKRYLSVASLEPKFLKQFCHAIGDDALFELAMDYDRKHQIEVKSRITNAIKQKSLDQWVEIFSKIDACIEPVLSVEETINHPQTVARGMVVEVPGKSGKKQKQIASPIKMSKSPSQYTQSGGEIGEHNREILAQLDYSEKEIQQLIKRGVFGELLSI